MNKIPRVSTREKLRTAMDTFDQEGAHLLRQWARSRNLPNLRPYWCGHSENRHQSAAAVRKALAFALASSLPFLGLTEALAQVTAVAGGNPNHIDLSIPVTASVSSVCGFSIGGVYTVAEINAGFSHDFNFALACNVPSRVAVQSLNGGLLATVTSPPSGYSNFAPYQVTLHLVGDAGVPGANAVCAANALDSDALSPCAFRGPASPNRGLALLGPSAGVAGSYLRVSAPRYAGASTLVAASTYADTLTVTLSAAP